MRTKASKKICSLQFLVLLSWRCSTAYGSLAQLAEQGTLNAKVRGSSPWRVILA